MVEPPNTGPSENPLRNITRAKHGIPEKGRGRQPASKATAHAKTCRLRFENRRGNQKTERTGFVFVLAQDRAHYGQNILR